MLIAIPQSLISSAKYSTLELDDTSFVSYSSEGEIEFAHMSVKTDLIEMVISGEKNIQGSDAKMTVQAGEAIFLRKGNYLMSEKQLDHNQPYKSILFFLGESFVRSFQQKYLDLAGLHPHRPPSQICKLPISLSMETYADSLIPFFHQPEKKIPQELFQLQLEELLLNLFHTDRNYEFRDFLLQLNHTIEVQLREFMEKKYREPLTLDQLAFLSGRSLSTFKRHFRSIFMQSPHKWIQEKRLQYALMLLKTENLNVGEVASQVGYDNLSHFVQLFKAKYGITPKQLQLQMTARAHF